MQLPISVCILSLNEEGEIGDCVSSISRWVSEVLVLDTGSSDRTIEEATLAGADVHQIHWKDDFSYARNKLIDLASSPYILMMDADERYEGDGRDLSEYINTSVLPGRVKIVNQLDGEEQSETYVTRIFANNGNFKYKGTVHEQLTDDGKAVIGVDTNIPFLHYGYLREKIESKKKMDRNLNLLLNELEQNPEDPYILYQIAKTLYVSKDYSQASIYYKKSLSHIDNEKFEYKYTPNLLLQYLYCLLYEKKWGLLQSILLRSIEKYPDFTDLYYIYASWIIEERKVELFNMLPDLYEKCIEIGEADPTRYETTKGVGSFKALYNLGLYYEMVGNKEKSINCYKLSSEMDYSVASKRLNILLK
ncbi:hypothetical protein PAECIP112173_03171 [Paenibacillus sp. JJ-100]|uniref:glycosyltransferase family 2 protein n=1 Tax=Paenibacillus sp. JJ-100 TaxID=2974896 RepID=UPI0022FF8A45|nr:glycosyltransferase family 2 protein [Paenibacillus sp. JJ-100]CAI6081291.1 hypothetical protein PAECIP112173_03171 [Paenibacillus sp. JJ-100]